jgi:DNA polymerase (family 10)
MNSIMKNHEIAKILYEIGYFLEMAEIKFKPSAYQKAAIILDDMTKDIETIYKQGGQKALEEIPGVGKNIAEKIVEYIETGKMEYFEKLKTKMPVKIDELLAVEGIGPKTIKALYEQLDIKDIQDLKKAAKKHKIMGLPGFQEKTEKNILQGIAFLEKSRGRFLLGNILPEVKEILEKLKTLKEVKQINVAGSVRRMKETIGDVDVLVASDMPKPIADFFVSMDGIEKVWAKGRTRCSIRMKQGFDCDLRVVSEKSYGSALQYFTGSKEHNIAVRKIAIKKGLKLNEYGIFKSKKQIGGRTEQEIYKILGMKYIAPELRENQGEVEASLENKLPKLIDYNDIKGDLHCHTNSSDGNNTIDEMAETAIKMGHEYLGISDHTKFLKINNGLDEKRLYQQREQIEKLNEKLKGKLRILCSAETNILNNGSIDINDNALKELDYAIAGIHSNFKMPKQQMTERIIRAIKNPYINIIAHPTGRILQKRERYECDFEKILRASKEFNKILEINSQPKRLDLNDRYIRRAKEMGVKMIINSDAHSTSHLRFIELGIAQARRGWAEREDIVNTKSLNNLFKLFHR